MYEKQDENRCNPQDSTANSEQHEILLEIAESRQQLSLESRRPRTFLSTRSKTFYTILLLLITIGGIMAIVFPYYKAHKKDAINNDNLEVSDDWYLDKNLMENREEPQDNPSKLYTPMNNNGDMVDRHPRLRAGSVYKRIDPPESLGHMNIYIREPTEDGIRRRSKQFRFPVARYSRQRFPLNGPFLSFTPRISIFVDRLTKQTIIYSPIGGIYLIPPLINFYGKMFSVAELIVSGYASLISNGAQPTGSINMMSYFQPIPLYGPDIPTISALTGGFIGGIRTNYRSFLIPKYPRRFVDLESITETEEEDDGRMPSHRQNDYNKQRPGPRPSDSVADIQWGQCTDPQLSGTNAECGFLSVPLDYAYPHGTKIQLALSRIKHSGPDDTFQGVILLNPGGPGEPGVPVVLLSQNYPKEINDIYDWIGFDPRGVGSSKPALSCLPSYFNGTRPNYIPSNQKLENIWRKRSTDYAIACGKNNSKLLAHMTTIDTAKDMESIRIALKQKRINYYGFSYGTYLGQVYSTLYPNRIRSMILDSNLDPRKIWHQAAIDQTIALDRNIRIWFSWLAKYDDVYHFGKSESEVEQLWLNAQKQLESNSANGIIGPDEWTDIFTATAYAQFYWPLLGDTFYQWVKNKDSTSLLQYYNLAENPGNDNQNAAGLATVCTDTEWPQSWEYVRTEGWRTFSKAPISTWSTVWTFEPCQYWPQRASKPTKVDGRKIGNILLIGETLDASTPFHYSFKVRQLFPKAILIAKPNGTTHISSTSPNPCVDPLIIKYLQSGEVPPRKNGDQPDVLCDPLPEPTPLTAPTSEPQITVTIPLHMRFHRHRHRNHRRF